MEITITTNFDLSKLDVDWINQAWLIGSSTRIRTQAQDNAPYVSWKLRQSIGVDNGGNINFWRGEVSSGFIKRWDKEVRVWPRWLVYAEVREFVNFKNPWRKFYMRRAFETAEKVVKEEFERAVGFYISKI